MAEFADPAPVTRSVALAHDLAGRLATVTPPGQPAHAFTYTDAAQVASYAPPDIADPQEVATRHEYDRDGHLVRTILPDHAEVGRTYDAAGRLSAMTTPHGDYARVYDTVDRLALVSGPPGEAPRGKRLTRVDRKSLTSRDNPR